jgi:hypothetical protein
MPDDSHERLANLRAIELRLKGELGEARAKYERANREFEIASSHAYGLGLSTVDGAHALHQAAKHQRVATTGYAKTVDRFCDFILRGKLPEE